MFLSTLALFALHDGICLREHVQQSNNSCIRTSLCTTTQNSDEDMAFLTCFAKIIAEQPFLTQYERPMYQMKEK